MGTTPYTTLDFYDMKGGINTAASAIALTREEARDAQNIEFFPHGGFRTRPGYDELNTLPLTPNACTGLYMARFSTAGGTNLALVVAGGNIYKMSAALAGTWTDITGSLTITVNSSLIWNFAILNNIVVLGNGSNSPIQVSSAGAASVLTAGMPWTTFKFPVEFNGYMFYFVPTVGGNVIYDRCYFSSLSDPTTVGTSNFINVSKDQGGGIGGAVNYKTSLFVFKRNGIYQINFQPTQVDSTGALFPFVQVPSVIVAGVGTQSHRSIVKFTTPVTHPTPGQELVFFVDQFGIPRIFDGATTISFQSKIGDSRDDTILSLADMNNTMLPLCHAINFVDKNQIWFFLSQNGSTLDTCWIMDYSRGFALSRYHFFKPFNASAIFEKATGKFKPYLADYAGTVFESDTGTSDAGAPIDAYYRTGDTYINSPAIKTKWRYLEARGVTNDVDEEVTMNFYINGGQAPAKTDSVAFSSPDTEWADNVDPDMIWGTDSWASAGVETKSMDINLDAKTLAIQFQKNELDEPMTLEGFVLLGENIGTERV